MQLKIQFRNQPTSYILGLAWGWGSEAAGPSAKAPNSLDETWNINISLAIRKCVHVSGSSSHRVHVGALLSDVKNSSGAGSGSV